MFTLDELSKQVTAYRDGRIDFDQFEDWYRNNSWGRYDRPGESVSDVIAAIEAAFSSYESDELTEQAFGEELAVAVRPFVWRTRAPIRLVYDERPRERRGPLVAAAAVAATVLWIPQPDALRGETPNRNIPTVQVSIGSPSSNTASASWRALPAALPVHAES